MLNLDMQYLRPVLKVRRQTDINEISHILYLQALTHICVASLSVTSVVQTLLAAVWL